MAIPCRSMKGDVNRQSKGDGHGTATTAWLGAPWRGNLKIDVSTSTPSSPNWRYLAGLGDTILEVWYVYLFWDGGIVLLHVPAVRPTPAHHGIGRGPHIHRRARRRRCVQRGLHACTLDRFWEHEPLASSSSSIWIVHIIVF
jgi:hypothetical protein